MKKAILVIIMCIVAIIAILLSVASPAHQTAPTNRKIDIHSAKTPSKPKERFWDLELESLVINNQTFSKGQQATIEVHVRQPVSITAIYKIKTIPINDITEADAKYWGSGNWSYEAWTAVCREYHCDDKKEKRRMPKFTYQDVLNWKKASILGARKVWKQQITFIWIAKKLNEWDDKYYLGALLTPIGFIETEIENNDNLHVGIFIVIKIRH